MDFKYKITGDLCAESAQTCVIRQPIYKWNFRYFKGDNTVYLKEKAPNFIHRFLQGVILGVHWERIKER